MSQGESNVDSVTPCWDQNRETVIRKPSNGVVG